MAFDKPKPLPAASAAITSVTDGLAINAMACKAEMKDSTETSGGVACKGAPVETQHAASLRENCTTAAGCVDGVGNDNGLCESSEACIYTPNIGAYQGHGRLQFMQTISGGNFSNIDLWRYGVNGY